ncbi:hypothetical protein Q7P37_011068 [Cladosporium fusiforme]
MAEIESSTSLPQHITIHVIPYSSTFVLNNSGRLPHPSVYKSAKAIPAAPRRPGTAVAKAPESDSLEVALEAALPAAEVAEPTAPPAPLDDPLVEELPLDEPLPVDEEEEPELVDEPLLESLLEPEELEPEELPPVTLLRMEPCGTVSICTA